MLSLLGNLPSYFAIKGLRMGFDNVGHTRVDGIPR